MTLPAIPEPIPPPAYARNLVSAAAQAAAGLPVTMHAFAPVAMVSTGSLDASAEKGDMDLDGGDGAGESGPTGMAVKVEEQVAESSGGTVASGCLGARGCAGGGYGPGARFEVARAAMAVTLEEWKPPPRPPLDAPPATPPPEPLPVNGYLWTALGKTAMVMDGLDLSPDKLQQLEALAAARGGGGGDDAVAAE